MRTQIEIDGPQRGGDLAELEKSLEEWLGDSGEVCDVAEDEEDWTISLVVEFDRPHDEIAQELLAILRKLNAPSGCEITVYEPRTYRL